MRAWLKPHIPIKRRCSLSEEEIGLVSGLLVVASIIPYSIRTYQGKIQPILTSWSLWTLNGLALLLTYKSSGAEANVWPAVFGFTNPLLITIIVLLRYGGWTKPNRVEIACLVFGLLSLGLWLGVRENKEMSQYALYLAIVADLFAAIPTIEFVWRQPNGDRPFAWALFAVGYGLAIFAITENTFANWVLPFYMICGSLSVAFPLALYRWRHKVPLSEWV
ncbi:MAG: hypothetical protein EXS46_02780 [Candidatus Taylorbacteria bacterium]|nr:hypothetical protein [Candidatus Taylorbacteria bacterium]